jgi:CheY-like chemotaxis protein
MALCKALVIEPDQKTLETINDILTTLDCNYEVADSLAQARKKLARGHHDLVLPAYDMPSMSGSKPRPQNAEHFMLALRKTRGPNMPKVIMLIAERPTVSDEDIARWAFDMRDLGVSDVVRKPLVDEGRTLDRVIKKVMGQDARGLVTSKAPAATVKAGDGDTSGWLTVTQSAELLLRDLPSLNLAKARSRISTAAGRKEFKFAGSRKGRRVDPVSFDAWRLKQRDRDLDAEDGDDEFE